MIVHSEEPEFAGLEGTPEPVICEHCGAQRHTMGMLLGDKVFWHPYGAEYCDCEAGQAEAQRARDEEVEREKAERRERAERLLQERIRRITNDSGMGERFLRRTLDTFEVETDEQKYVLKLATRFARHFDGLLPGRDKPLPKQNGFIITGPKGTGKTHIAAGIANYLLRQGTPVICMPEHALYGRIKSTYDARDGTDEADVLRLYATVPLLVIDDLGKERATAWSVSTLFSIIDSRYEAALPLIITTNYDTGALTGRLTPPGDDGVTAEAVVDRLREMSVSVTLTGESRRIANDR
ncbi:MAG: ATP-binding protein [Oscillospiraceae bacterium]|nr:ATP-binding protein [Oscillospiraceae bacterium]